MEENTEKVFKLDVVDHDNVSYNCWLYMDDEDALYCGDLRKEQGEWSLVCEPKTVYLDHKSTLDITCYDDVVFSYKLGLSFDNAVAKLKARLQSYVKQAKPRKLTDCNPYYVFNSRKKKALNPLKRGRADRLAGRTIS